MNKQLVRIIITLAMYVVALVLNAVLNIPTWLSIVMFAVLYVVIGYDVVISAVKHVIHGQMMDETFLMTVATVGAFFVEEYADAVAVMLLYQVGELFQSYAVNNSRKSISSLIEIRSETATVMRNSQEVTLHPSEVSVGEVIVVKVGERIPLDGIITQGTTQLNTSALTGESMPTDVTQGCSVHSGCINLTSPVLIRVTADYDNTTVAKILDMVENAVETKSPTENFITTFSKYYTPVVVALALVIGIVPPLFDGLWATWLKRTMMFLFVSCPCALVISVPLGFFGGIAGCAKCGIFVKGGNYLETLGKVNTFAFDKTGTVTKGQFEVTRVLPESDSQRILTLASIAEQYSTHPVAKCIVNVCPPCESCTVTEVAGKGLRAETSFGTVTCGNASMMKDNGIDVDKADQGTVVYVALNNNYVGCIVVEDVVKDNANDVITTLNRNYNTVMLTGDNYPTADKIARQVGVRSFCAELLPQDKTDIVAKLKKDGIVAFVGDGINDAPVLATADVGIAMGALGSDSAIEASDVVLMDDDLSGIVTAVNIAKKTVKIVKQNVIASLAVKFAVLLLTATGIVNSMVLAIFADVGITVLAVLNSMRTIITNKKVHRN